MPNSIENCSFVSKKIQNISKNFQYRKKITTKSSNLLLFYCAFSLGLFTFHTSAPGEPSKNFNLSEPGFNKPAAPVDTGPDRTAPYIILAQAAGGRADPAPDPETPDPEPAEPDPEPAAPDPEPAAPDPEPDPNAGLGSPGEGKIGGLLDLINAPDVGLTNGITSAIVDDIAAIATTCESIPGEYRIDCLGKGFTLLAKSMPNHIEYKTARTEIAAAGKALRKIARQNQDRAKPRLRRTQQVANVANARRSRAFRPVKEAALEQATEQAIKVIVETQTRLLRSAEGSERRRVHYQTIARSIGSTTRILRS